jgi:hypothetical protein
MHTQVSKLYNIHYTQCRYVFPLTFRKPRSPVFLSPADVESFVSLFFFTQKTVELYWGR